MESPDMTPERAAALLDAELRAHPWYISVGVGSTTDGRPLLVVYATGLRHRELLQLTSGWKGYEVVPRAVGRIRAIADRRLISAG